MQDLGTAGTTNSIWMHHEERQDVRCQCWRLHSCTGNQIRDSPIHLPGHPGGTNPYNTEQERIQATGGGVSISRRDGTWVLWHKANGISLPMVTNHKERGIGGATTQNMMLMYHQFLMCMNTLSAHTLAFSWLWQQMGCGMSSALKRQMTVNSFQQDELENCGEEESEFRYSKVAETLPKETLRE